MFTGSAYGAVGVARSLHFNGRTGVEYIGYDGHITTDIAGLTY